MSKTFDFKKLLDRLRGKTKAEILKEQIEVQELQNKLNKIQNKLNKLKGEPHG